MHPLGRFAAAAVVSAALLGGLAAAAPAASASTSSDLCARRHGNLPKPVTEKVDRKAINLRSKIGAVNSPSLGILYKGTKFSARCRLALDGISWDYGKVLTGANTGKWGWVPYDYVRNA
ncbi:SH3 domain-containing protein [Streptomyces alanosinicus]|uniref:SH3 domain-containing protein n=1 Tax=Streptomyces alanosinicus TaxID=68171 RepID=A0A919D906_9ACTN|nr:SH3 domain-containing protein [Streptomyces alanosinicus]GHE14511.1 hypothetical protein GCM10010339_85480 [Streptomyces alanosinicus]